MLRWLTHPGLALVLLVVVGGCRIVPHTVNGPWLSLNTTVSGTPCVCPTPGPLGEE